jgi:hypothetical protein
MSYCITRMRVILDDMGDSEGVSRADEASDKIDDSLGNLAQTVDGVAGIDSDSENTRLAREIRDDLFPNGVAHITTQPFDDQHLAVDKVLGRLRNDYAEHVEKLSLEPLTEQRERARRHYQRRGTVPPVDPNDDPTRPDGTGPTDGGQPTGDNESTDDNQSSSGTQSSGDGDGPQTDG